MKENENTKVEKPKKKKKATNNNKPNKYGILALGLYLFIGLILSVSFMAVLMMAETLEYASDAETKKQEAIVQNENKNASNSNQNANLKSLNPTNSANPVNKSENTDTNVNNQVNSSVNGNENTNTTVVNTNKNAKVEKIEDEKANNRAPVTVPKNIILSFMSKKYALTGDGYFFLVVLFAGFIGAMIRCLFSFFTHLGRADFSFNWTAYYLLLPFTGATLSLVIYFVIRGGFYSSSIGNDLALNLFSFAALGALTGLFSDNAMAKLKQVSESLLTPVEPKTDEPEKEAKAKKVKADKD